MKPSTKIATGASVIVATIAIQEILWIYWRYQLQNTLKPESLEKAMEQSQSLSTNLAQGASNLAWIPNLVGFIFIVLGIYQAAKSVENLKSAYTK